MSDGMRKMLGTHFAVRSHLSNDKRIQFDGTHWHRIL